MSVITTSSQMSFSARRCTVVEPYLPAPTTVTLGHQAPSSSLAMTASATWLVPTAVGSSRDGFMS